MTEEKEKFYKLRINVDGKRNCFFFKAKGLEFIGVEENSIFAHPSMGYTFGEITEDVIKQTEDKLGLEKDISFHYYQGKTPSDNTFDF